jgi:zinc protease
VGRKILWRNKRGEAIPKMETTRTLINSKKLYYEDNFVEVSSHLTWPSVYEYHPDSYALEVLATFER